MPAVANPCNFLIWMHVELLPNRALPSDQRQGLPWGSVPAPVRLKFGLFSWQVGASGALLLLQCNNVGFVLQPQQKARPRGRTLLLGVSLTLLHSHILTKSPRPTGLLSRPSRSKHMPKRPLRTAGGRNCMFAPSTCRRGHALGPGAKHRSIASGTHSIRHVAQFLSIQQCWLRSCSPSMQEAFLMVSCCGQSAKLTGNTLHQIQDCGGSTALHARAILVSSADAIFLYKIRRHAFPYLHLD